jgi:hypothetical protein
MSDTFRWTLVGGKRPCDGCGIALKVEEVICADTMRGLVYCLECFKQCGKVQR